MDFFLKVLTINDLLVRVCLNDSNYLCFVV